MIEIIWNPCLFTSIAQNVTLSKSQCATEISIFEYDTFHQKWFDKGKDKEVKL